MRSNQYVSVVQRVCEGTRTPVTCVHQNLKGGREGEREGEREGREEREGGRVRGREGGEERDGGRSE